MTLYRANFGDGTWTKAFADVGDAKMAKWGRAAIVQYRTSIEVYNGAWRTMIPARATLNGPATGHFCYCAEGGTPEAGKYIVDGDDDLPIPTCKGNGHLPNPEGKERFDLTHTDGYALRHRWL